jgi:guanylate kinase
LASGIDVILEIDWQGASQVRMMAPDAVSIFILPPTRDALRERLIGRQQDDSTIIDARMAEADETIEQAPHFDYWVINDDFEMALGQLKSIIISHRQRRPQIQAKHPNFLEKLLGHQ